nr:uncharacterized protein LOC111506158 [Leptinotarsa decemlineata]
MAETNSQIVNELNALNDVEIQLLDVDDVDDLNTAYPVEQFGMSCMNISENNEQTYDEGNVWKINPLDIIVDSKIVCGGFIKKTTDTAGEIVNDIRDYRQLEDLNDTFRLCSSV